MYQLLCCCQWDPMPAARGVLSPTETVEAGIESPPGVTVARQRWRERRLMGHGAPAAGS
jgi:hypothetical protein